MYYKLKYKNISISIYVRWLRCFKYVFATPYTTEPTHTVGDMDCHNNMVIINVGVSFLMKEHYVAWLLPVESQENSEHTNWFNRT